MEQEETIASVKSATARETLGDNSSASAVSLHSPSPDTEILSTMSVEGADGDDQSVDLSSDGKYELLDDFSKLCCVLIRVYNRFMG